jgi:hypothetical protein
LFQVLESLPTDTQTHPDLLKLKSYLEVENTESGILKRINSTTTPSTTTGKSSSVEPVLAGKRQILHLTESVAPALNQSL